MRPGTAPPPPTDPTRRSSLPSSSSGHEPTTRRVRRRAGGLRARGHAVHRPGAACRARRSRPPAAPGRAVGPARPRRCSRPARDAATDPLLLGDIARLRGHIEVNIGSATEAHRIFVEAAQRGVAGRPGPRPGDGGRGRHHAHLRRRQRRPRAGDRHSLTFPTRRPAPGAVPQADAAGDDPGRRGRLVRRRRGARRWRSGRRDRSTTATCWGTSGNAALQLGDDDAQQHFYAVALSRAREAGAVTAVVYCLQRLCFGHYLSPATASPSAAAPRRPSPSARASASPR